MKNTVRSRTIATLTAFLIALIGLFTAAPAAQAATGADIARVATQNLGKRYCDTNSYGGKGFANSCQGMAWCAEFARWVWQALGFDTAGLNAGAVSFANYGNARGTHDTRPQVGDAVVYGWDKYAGWAEHVGIITEVRSDGTIAVANGNWGASPTTSSVQMSYGTGKIGSYIDGQQISAFVRPAGTSAPATPTTSATTPQNCPLGYVCVYPSTNFTVTPSLKYYNYGTVNFYNQFGNKVIFNNQTGGAIAQVFTGTSGTGTATTINPGTWKTLNFDPLNSIKLADSGPTTTTSTTPKNCPAGYVCVYPGTDPGATPSLRYYNYGTANFANQLGNKLIYNNQTGGASAKVFTGYYGTGTGTSIPAGRWTVLDFTPLNSITLSATASATPAAPVPGTAPSNCPAGYVCVYPGKDFKATPSLRYYNYGTFNFTNQYGAKVIYNNQTGGAAARVYTGTSGSGTATYIAAGTWTTVDFTPLNSIKLSTS